MELTIEEQTLVANYRKLDEPGKRELLRHASQQQMTRVNEPGQCSLGRREERPESVAEPIFTE